MNNCNGVVGVFNCQGAGWCRVGKKNLIHDEQPETVTGIIRAKDIDYLPKLADEEWDGDAVLYSHLAGMPCRPIALGFVSIMMDLCRHLPRETKMIGKLKW